MQIRILIGTAVLIFVCSCSSISSMSFFGLNTANDIKKISVEATSDCNRNMPVAMDIVFINDKKVAPLLAALSGPEWFDRKQELLMRYSKQISLSSLEIVPLSVKGEIPLPKKHKKANSVLFFANYLAGDGQYVAELGHYKKLNIRLERDRYQLQEQKK